MTDISEYIRTIRAEYDAHHTDLWQHDYFNSINGGYLLIDKQRIKQGNVSKQEKGKYKKEYDMCLNLAQNGHKIKLLNLAFGFDIFLDDISADLKKTAGSGNIVKYAKKAINKQGAYLVVFEFDKESSNIYSQIKRLSLMGIRGKYYFTGKKNSIHDF